jgi:hypothetical protein
MRYALQILALSIVVSAQSQPPTPVPTKPTQGDQKQEDTKQQKTDITNKTRSAPAIITTIEHGNHPNGATDDPPSNWWLIIPTIVIAGAAIVQALIYMKQAKTMAENLVETRKASEATLQSFVMSHRPKLAIRFYESIAAAWGIHPDSGGV